jgi:hypothetical protein
MVSCLGTRVPWGYQSSKWSRSLLTQRSALSLIIQLGSLGNLFLNSLFSFLILLQMNSGTNP